MLSSVKSTEIQYLSKSMSQATELGTAPLQNRVNFYEKHHPATIFPGAREWRHIQVQAAQHSGHPRPDREKTQVCVPTH